MSITETAENLGHALRRQGMRLAVAESCTGGWLAKAITDQAGSSDWFDCGLVTYSNRAKQQLLGVNESTLKQHGAVSEAVALEMVQGLFKVSDVDLAVSITGVAGPDGGTPEKPVGTVWFACGQRRADAKPVCRHFSGDRASVREQAVAFALSFLLKVAEA